MTADDARRRLTTITQKSHQLKYYNGLITPSLTWEDHLEIEVLEGIIEHERLTSPAND